jgi:hypothetical protein
MNTSSPWCPFSAPEARRPSGKGRSALSPCARWPGRPGIFGPSVARERTERPVSPAPKRSVRSCRGALGAADRGPNPLYEAKRDPRRVYLLGIVCVPWQDLATDATLGDPSALELMTATDLSAKGRWDWFTPHCKSKVDGACDTWELAISRNVPAPASASTSSMALASTRFSLTRPAALSTSRRSGTSTTR